MDSDQTQHFVKPDQGWNSLQRKQNGLLAVTDLHLEIRMQAEPVQGHYTRYIYHNCEYQYFNVSLSVRGAG